MKRMFFLLIVIGMEWGMTAMAGADPSKMREETRFLTDKMAYELGLTARQYNDVYEINYDFVCATTRVMEEVVRGYEWAMEEYYGALDIRNDDLRWVLSDVQYRRLMGADYFYRPIHITGGKWSFRVYARYPNRAQFYFGLPQLYYTYLGAHRRPDLHHVSYYRNRHAGLQHHPAPPRMKEQHVVRSYRRADFGSVRIRPHSSVRPQPAPGHRPQTDRRPPPVAPPVRRHEPTDKKKAEPAPSVRHTGNVRHNSAAPSRAADRKPASVAPKRKADTPARSEEHGGRTRR